MFSGYNQSKLIPNFQSILMLHSLKVPGPISQPGYFYPNDASSPKKSWFQISVKSVTPF